MSSLSYDSSTTLDRIESLATDLFGTRGESENQEPTGAAGLMPRVQVLFVAKQGGPVVTEEIGPYWDARVYLYTKRKKGEWTGYHAEMMIVSAMLRMLSRDARDLTVMEAKDLLGQCGAPVIAANAACCKHCSNMLDLLGIVHPTGSTKASLTGWWNPFTDAVYAHGSTEFGKDVPGEN